MSRTKRNGVVALALISVACCWTSLMKAAADEPKTQPATKTQADFMRRKLKTVATIVEGLSTDDFEMIRRGAQEMKRIRDSAQFEGSKDPFYALYSRSFGSTIDLLAEAAGNEDIEKSTFAYVHLTMSCTACHQRIRNVKRVAHGF